MLILQMRKMKTEELNRLVKVTLELMNDFWSLNSWISDALEFPIISCSFLGEIFKVRPDLNQSEKFEQWDGDRLD